jgi:hypothetical protein
MRRTNVTGLVGRNYQKSKEEGGMGFRDLHIFNMVLGVAHVTGPRLSLLKSFESSVLSKYLNSRSKGKARNFVHLEIDSLRSGSAEEWYHLAHWH